MISASLAFRASSSSVTAELRPRARRDVTAARRGSHDPALGRASPTTERGESELPTPGAVDAVVDPRDGGVAGCVHGDAWLRDALDHEVGVGDRRGWPRRHAGLEDDGCDVTAAVVDLR